jgi:protein phosphatase 1 regulatory subunit 3A/B/C/D/E
MFDDSSDLSSSTHATLNIKSEIWNIVARVALMLSYKRPWRQASIVDKPFGPIYRADFFCNVNCNLTLILSLSISDISLYQLYSLLLFDKSERPMEPAEEPGQISKDNFLEVPNLSDSVCEDEEVKATFKPGFSPQPSRRGSGSSEDMYLDTPTSASRRVSFADSLGFSLVSVKEFDCWELPSVSTDFDLSGDVFHTDEYVLSPLFDLPSSKEKLMEQLQVQKAVLESAEHLPGSSMKGIIRVLNISFEKLVYVRMSLDDWQTHYDILAEYVPNSCDGETDQFSFKISLVPPYQKEGGKVEFCIRYETSAGTFWSNNNGTNYILVCQKKRKEPEPVKPLEEAPSRQIKGCLKVKSR